MRTPGIILLATLIAGSPITSAFGQNAQTQAKHDSLWAVWSDPSQADTNRLEALKKISWGYFQKNQIDSVWFALELKYDFAKSKGLKEHVANALADMGYLHGYQGAYPQAWEYYQKSLELYEEIGAEEGISFIQGSIGDFYHKQGDHARALHHYLISLKLRRSDGAIASMMVQIGNVHLTLEDHEKALEYFQKSLDLFTKKGARTGTAVSLGNIGIIHFQQGAYDQAMDHFQRCLDIFKERGDEAHIAEAIHHIGKIHQVKGEFDEALDHFNRSLEIRLRLGDKIAAATSLTALGDLHIAMREYPRALASCAKSLKLAGEMQVVQEQKEACQCLYNAYKAMGRGNEALVHLEKIGELDKQLNKEETAKKIQEMEFQQVMLQDSIAKAEEARLVQEAHQEEVRKSTRTRNMLAVSGGFFVLLAGGFYSRARYMRRSRSVLQVEKDRSENLLLNILPAEIAEELKQKGRCEARDFDLVSILFTDFKGFTEQSATMSAAALVNEINTCFEAFDGIIAKFGIEKIKTIGDAYMAAGGLPVPREDSVKNTVLAALEMQRFIKERKVQKDALGEPAFEMRVGIHTGPVVAGIVGVKKFQYDIWGDTVNTASRMESMGEVGCVNISAATHIHLGDATGLRFIHRGMVDAKGKGALTMYFVESITDEVEALVE
jgi:adenylate cyclase